MNTLEWKSFTFLEALADKTSLGNKIQQTFFNSSGRVPIVDQGAEYIAGYSDDSSLAWSAELPVVVFGDHTRAIKYVDFPFILGADGVKVLVPREGLSAKFAYYYLSSLAIPSRGYSRHFRFLKEFQVPVPPLAEQERIVRLLDEADELRKLRAQADRRSADLIPALFHEMFGDPMENPRGWPTHPVSSFVAELHGGRSVNSAGADEATGRFRILKISAVTWGEFQPDESKPVPAAYEPPASHLVRAGDLLFSRANTTELVAATSYVFGTPPNLLLPDKLWRFVWKEPRTIEPLFVWWLFQAASVRRELGARATGTGGSMKNISKSKVMTLEVPVPPLPLQKQFAQRVSEIRALQAVQAASRQRTEHLFQSMLHRAFNQAL